MALSNVILGVHVGPGIGHYIDAKLLKHKYNVGFIMADVMDMLNSDPDDDYNRDLKYWYRFVQEAWDADIPIFGIIKHNPIWSTGADDNVIKHLKVLAKQMKDRTSSVSGLLVETAHVLDPGTGKPIAPHYINERTRMMVDMTQNIYTRTWVGTHTNQGVIDNYSPAMRDWVGRYMLYWARWIQSGDKAAAWADLPYPDVTPNNIPTIFPGSNNSTSGNPAFWNWSGNYFNNLDGIWMDEAHTVRGTPKLTYFFGSQLELQHLAFYTPHGEVGNPPPDDNANDDDNNDNDQNNDDDDNEDHVAIDLTELVNAVKAVEQKLDPTSRLAKRTLGE